jgi:hypothetical protein
MRLVLLGLSIVEFALNALAESGLFDQGPSQGELDAIRKQGEAAGKALDAVDELQKLVLVWRGNAEAVSALLRAGAEVDISLRLSDEHMPMIWGDQERSIARNGGTPLMMAVALRHAAVARELVRAGADPKRSIDVRGKTISPEGLAAEAGSPLLIQALQVP